MTYYTVVVLTTVTVEGEALPFPSAIAVVNPPVSVVIVKVSVFVNVFKTTDGDWVTG